MLFDESEESPGVRGFGFFPGKVKRFTTPGLKVPQIGWNQLDLSPHPLWRGIADATRFYFAHSYYPVPDDSAMTAGTVDYPTAFTCAIASANIFAVQFHPEKSHSAGLQLLANFVTWDGRV